MKKRKSYPEPDKREMTQAWKELVWAALAARGVDGRRGITWLARETGYDHGGLSKALDLKRGQPTSSAVDAICRVLDLPPPLEPVTSDERVLLEAYRKMTEIDRARTDGFVEAITSASPAQGEKKK